MSSENAVQRVRNALKNFGEAVCVAIAPRNESLLTSAKRSVLGGVDKIAQSQPERGRAMAREIAAEVARMNDERISKEATGVL